MYYVCQYTNNYPAFWWKKTYPFTCVCLTLPWKSHNKMASPTLISPRLSGVKATCWMWSEWPIKTYLKNRKKDFWLWFPVEVGMIQRSWNMQTFLYDESRFPSQSSIFSSSLDDKEKYQTHKISTQSQNFSCMWGFFPTKWNYLKVNVQSHMIIPNLYNFVSSSGQIFSITAHS